MKFLIISFFYLFIFENHIEAGDNVKFKLTAINTSKAIEHIKENKVTFLEVGSESCFSCQVMGKNIESVKNKNQKFNVIFVDVFQDATALKMFNVEVIPTQIVTSNNGKEIFRHVGVLEKDQIENLISKYQIIEGN